MGRRPLASRGRRPGLVQAVQGLEARARPSRKWWSMRRRAGCRAPRQPPARRRAPGRRRAPAGPGGKPWPLIRRRAARDRDRRTRPGCAPASPAAERSRVCARSGGHRSRQEGPGAAPVARWSGAHAGTVAGHAMRAPDPEVGQEVGEALGLLVAKPQSGASGACPDDWQWRTRDRRCGRSWAARSPSPRTLHWVCAHKLTSPVER